MKNKFKNSIMLLLSLLCLLNIEVDAATAPKLQSSGKIDYEGKIIIDTNDLQKLLKSINDLNTTVTTNKGYIISGLNSIGTYYTSAGLPTKSVQSNQSKTPTYANLSKGIKDSQNVLSGSAITANNLAAGTCGWINGKFIVGNGAVINQKYNQGFNEWSVTYLNQGAAQGTADGTAQGQAVNQSKVAVENLYHHHEGNENTLGGCYTVVVPHQHDQGGVKCESRIEKHTYIVLSANVTDSAHIRKCSYCDGSVVTWYRQLLVTRPDGTQYEKREENFQGHCDRDWPGEFNTRIITCNKTVDRYDLGCGLQEGQQVGVQVTMK